MSSYDYDPPRERTTRRYVREERRETREPRYDDDSSYLKPYPPSHELVPRGREDSDLSVEEIRRDFPPPGYRDMQRARSAEPGYYDRGYDPRDRDRDSDRSDRDRDRDHDRRHKKGPGSTYYEEEKESRKRVLSKQEKIVAAVAGAALAFGGKEVYDRREAKGHGGEIQRNYLTSAALGAAGALAGYQGADFYNKHAAKEEKKATYIVHRGRDGKVTEYYSDDEEDGKEKKGHKSFLENALAASGLGVAVKALTGGGGHDDKKDGKSRRGSPDSRSRSKSRSRGGEGGNTGRVQKAAMASLIAGATEAFRVSKEPGGWKGEKAKRILTAAAGAATIDAAQNPEKNGKLGLAESVIGGLIGNRVINGSKNNIEEDKKTGRSRSRSRAREGGGGGGGVSGLAALATAGLGAFGAKKVLDHTRSHSRGRSESPDSRDGDRRHRSRSRSVVDSARKKLAKFGIGNGPDDRDKDRDRRDDRDDDSRSSRKAPRRYSDDGYDDYGRGSTRGSRDDYDDDRSTTAGSRRRDRSRRRGGRSDAGSDTDLGDSSEDEKRAKKMRDRRH